MSSGLGPSTLREFNVLFASGTVAGLSDGQLLERFLGDRDEIAFAALVARHGPMVLGVCRRALSDPEDAADAFQATFLILVKKARSVRVDDSLGRWLYGVSRKVAGRARVVAARRPKGEAGEMDSLAAPSPDPDRFELLGMLDEELGRLPDAFRSAIVLCDLGGLTHEEAARDLCCPVGTIKSRLARARKRLRERLERRGLSSTAVALAPSVPAALVRATARVSWLSAMSGPSTAGVVPASSVILAQEVLKAMTGFPLKVAAAAVLSLGFVATGAGVLAGGQDEGKAKADPAATKVESPFVEGLSRIQESRRLLIEVVGGDQARLEGKAMTLESLTNALKALNGANDPPSTKVHLRAASDQRYSDVVRVVYAIELAGIRDIRFDPAGSEVEAKLDKPVSLVVSERPLSEVIDLLGSETGLSIALDNVAFQRKGLTSLAPVTIAVKDLPLRKTLKYMLRPLDLTYQIEDDSLLITTTRDRALESLQQDLDSSRKRLDKARRIAINADDPAIVLATRRVTELEAEIEKLNKTQPDNLKESVATYRPKRVEELSGTPRANRRPPAEPSREFAKVAMPEYVIEPPDIITVEVLQALPGRPITGERLVRPDGTINLGYYGEVYVSGLKTGEVKEKIALHLLKYLDEETLGLTRLDLETGKKVLPSLTNRISVDVVSYNSKAYYVQGDVGVPGRLPITGNETVLDAINYAGGLIPTAARNKIQLVRPNPPGAKGAEVTLDVDLEAIIKRGDPTTNYQLFPGDRLVVYRDEKAAAVINPTAKPEAGKAPDVEGRLQALERKLDEVLKALERSTKP